MLGAVYVPLTGRLVEREDGVAMRIRLAVAALPAGARITRAAHRRC